jgi:hypothetical protein
MQLRSLSRPPSSRSCVRYCQSVKNENKGRETHGRRSRRSFWLWPMNDQRANDVTIDRGYRFGTANSILPQSLPSSPSPLLDISQRRPSLPPSSFMPSSNAEYTERTTTTDGSARSELGTFKQKLQIDVKQPVANVSLPCKAFVQGLIRFER